VAKAVSSAASNRPTQYPWSSSRMEAQVRCGMTPLAMALKNACTVALKVGKTSGLSTLRA